MAGEREAGTGGIQEKEGSRREKEKRERGERCEDIRLLLGSPTELSGLFQRLIREEWEALKEKERAENEVKEREKREKEVTIQLLIDLLLAYEYPQPECVVSPVSRTLHITVSSVLVVLHVFDWNTNLSLSFLGHVTVM